MGQHEEQTPLCWGVYSQTKNLTQYYSLRLGNANIQTHRLKMSLIEDSQLCGDYNGLTQIHSLVELGTRMSLCVGGGRSQTLLHVAPTQVVLSLSFSFGACTWLLQYKDDYIAVSPVQTSLKPQTRGQLIRVVQCTCNHVEASIRSRSCLYILARPAVCCQLCQGICRRRLCPNISYFSFIVNSDFR